MSRRSVTGSKKIFRDVSKTVGGHRRFCLLEVQRMLGINVDEPEKKVVLYSCVSSHDQKDDLVRQGDELKEHCRKQQIGEFEEISDIGSGINYQKTGIKKLLKKIMDGQVKQIVVSYKDRLMRFGSEMLQQICEMKNVAITVLHESEKKDFESQLAQDVLTILTVYCSKIYGKRSHERKKPSVQKMHQTLLAQS